MMDKQNNWVSIKLLVSDCVITCVRVSTKTCQTRATLLMFVKLNRIFFSLTSVFLLRYRSTYSIYIQLQYRILLQSGHQ